MVNQLETRDLQGRLEHLEALLREVQALADPQTGPRFQEIVQLLLGLYGDGLSRLVEYVAARGDVGRDILEECGRDSVLSGLLLLHGLHPLDLTTRVQQALDEVAPYLKAHDGSVELVSVDGGVVRVRLHGHCDGCPSSSATMKQTIEEAIIGKAPEVTSVELDQTELEIVSHNGRARVALPVL